MVRSEPAHLPQGPSAPAIDRPAGAADPCGPDGADHRQADYFVRLLSENRELVDQRIDDYQKAIVTAQASGDVDVVCNLQRMALVEKRDRGTIDGLIDKLRGRFPRRSPG